MLFSLCKTLVNPCGWNSLSIVSGSDMYILAYLVLVILVTLVPLAEIGN